MELGEYSPSRSQLHCIVGSIVELSDCWGTFCGRGKGWQYWRWWWMLVDVKLVLGGGRQMALVYAGGVYRLL
jgi:hypothetical protein